MVNSATVSAENMALIIDNLTKTIEQLNATVASLQVTVQELKNDNNLLLEENKYLKRKLFGTKSETAHSLGFDQLSFFDEVEKECEPELLEEISYTRAKKRFKDERKLKLENLKHVEEIYTIDENDRICNICGTVMVKVGKELVRQEVVYQPAKLYVKDIYRETYECRKCRKENIGHMYKAGTPNPVIPHSYASPSAVAQIMTDKFVNHMPLYRQEAEWKRLGLDLSRATMANWMIIASKEYLIPLVNKMHEILLRQKYIHCDETTVQVLNEPGRENTTESYMWVYSSIRESEMPIKIFEYHPTRSQDAVKKFLGEFKGTIITDGYAGYNELSEEIANAYCWAHARRKFVEAIPSTAVEAEGSLAKEATDKIGELFKIEKEIDNLTAEEKFKIRQKKSKPLVDKFFSWCHSNEDRVLARSKTGKAIHYCIKLEEGLRAYLDDGLIPMTNSLDERTIRPFTVGRKNWLFSASPKGAEASAAIFSIIETAKANQLDPYDYLEYLFEMMPDEDFISNPDMIESYLPWADTVKKLFE